MKIIGDLNIRCIRKLFVVKEIYWLSSVVVEYIKMGIRLNDRVEL